jgi:signal transduction histidine kinase
MRFVKPAWLNSLSLRVLLAYLIGAMLSIALMALVTVTVLTVRSDFLLTTDMLERSKELAEKLQFDGAGMPIGFDASEDDIAWLYESLKQETAYRVLDASGRVVLSSAAGEAFWGEAPRQLRDGGFTFEHKGSSIYGATTLVEHGGRTWWFEFAASKRLVDLMHQHFALPFMGAGITVFSLVLLFVFGACAYVTLGYTLRPLRAVSASAAAISPSSIHARLQLRGVPSEIAPLVESFNRVLERLEHGFRVQQEFLATAAHELKTPLSLIRAQIELSEAGADRDSLLKDVEHMSRQVQQLLLLAEASEVQNYSFASVDVLEVTNEVVAFLERMAQAAGVLLSAPEHTEAIRWLADRGAFFTVLKNLMENAIQHAPRGTAVRVEVSDETLTVRDWGPGAEPEQLSKMFARFWRGAHRRDEGAGLGLAICQEIVQAHGWTLSAHRAEPGLRFLLSRSNADVAI